MCVAKLLNFERTGRGGSSRLGEVGGEGVTHNTLLREGRLRISDHIGRISVREKGNISIDEVNKEGSLKLRKKVTKFTKK